MTLDTPNLYPARYRHAQVVDKATAKEPYSKAFGLHARTLEHFMGMGVLPAILQEASATTKVTVRSSIARASYGWGSIQCKSRRVLASGME